jgi:2'-5' RNA ligase
MKQATVSPMSPMVRLFIAVELSHSIKHELSRIEKIFKKSSVVIGNYPQDAAMHLTLKFIGDEPPEKISTIQSCLRDITGQSMQAQLALLGVFGDPRYPKVLYIDVECPLLQEFVRRLDEALKDLCKPEERKFKGHLTIARVKQTLDSEGLLELLGKTYVNPLSFVIDHFILMKSELTSNCPIYTMVERYNLSA